jgi:hypothetical protein
MGLGSGIRKKPNPDPGVKKAPDPGSGSATLLNMISAWFLKFSDLHPMKQSI